MTTTENIFIHYLELPDGVHACVTHNADDTYSIFLDPRDSRAMQIEHLMHELCHIFNGDFSKADVQQIEAEVRKMT